MPSVPLVSQQTENVHKHTNLKAKPFCGEMGVDFWDREKWIVELDIENTDVVVMTPQIMYNMLAHSYFSMDRIALIVLVSHKNRDRTGQPSSWGPNSHLRQISSFSWNPSRMKSTTVEVNTHTMPSSKISIILLPTKTDQKYSV